MAIKTGQTAESQEVLNLAATAFANNAKVGIISGATSSFNVNYSGAYLRNIVLMQNFAQKQTVWSGAWSGLNATNSHYYFATSYDEFSGAAALFASTLWTSGGGGTGSISLDGAGNVVIKPQTGTTTADAWIRTVKDFRGGSKDVQIYFWCSGTDQSATSTADITDGTNTVSIAELTNNEGAFYKVNIDWTNKLVTTYKNGVILGGYSGVNITSVTGSWYFQFMQNSYDVEQLMIRYFRFMNGTGSKHTYQTNAWATGAGSVTNACISTKEYNMNTGSIVWYISTDSGANFDVCQADKAVNITNPGSEIVVKAVGVTPLTPFVGSQDMTPYFVDYAVWYNMY